MERARHVRGRAPHRQRRARGLPPRGRRAARAGRGLQRQPDFRGQIGAERCRLFQIYAAGNFIEAGEECPYFQIGEAKYGKPILDRVLQPDTPLDEAAKCALISMDSTLRSNISVGLPLDLLVYDTGALRVTHFASIDEHNEYFRMIRGTWGERLRQVFAEIPDPLWTNPESPDSWCPPAACTSPSGRSDGPAAGKLPGAAGAGRGPGSDQLN